MGNVVANTSWYLVAYSNEWPCEDQGSCSSNWDYHRKCVGRAPARARECKRTRKLLDSGYVRVHVQQSIFHSLRYSLFKLPSLRFSQL